MEFGKNHPLEPFYKKKPLEMAAIFFQDGGYTLFVY